MDYAKKSELIKALSDKFIASEEVVNDEGSTRYDANTGTIYANTGRYTAYDLEEARQKVAELAKKCTSINSSIVLEPSFIRYANIIDACLLLCKTQLKKQ